MDPVSVGNDPEVVRKNVLSSMTEGEKESRQALDELPAVRSRAGALESRSVRRRPNRNAAALTGRLYHTSKPIQERGAPSSNDWKDSSRTL